MSPSAITAEADAATGIGAHRLAVVGGVALVALLALRLLAASEADPVVLRYLLLPRLLAGVLAGAGLGMAGAVLQGLTRNPLASPSILGITAGAHLALVLAVVAGGVMPPVVAAFGGAVAATALTWVVAGREGRQGAGLALAGIAVTLACSALASAATLLNEERAGGVFLWSAGSLVQGGWANVLDVGPWIVAGLAAALPLARGLDVMALGEALASGLGVRRLHLTLAVLAAAALTSGAAVALAGPVAFIGLLAPNGLRRLGVRRHAALLPLSALWGALVLVAADCLAAWMSGAGREVPVGVITALIGAPVLIRLVMRSRPVARRPRAGTPAGGRLRAHAAIPPALLVLAAIALVALGLGDPVLGPRALMAFVGGEGSELVRLLLVEFRLPRLAVALLAGALLAAAGFLLQGTLGNPLAGPETLGITQGAALAALALLMAVGSASPWVLQAGAFAGAGAVAVGLTLAGRRRAFAPEQLILTGLALAALFAAVSALALVLARLEALKAVLWLTGSVYGSGWDDLTATLPTALIVLGLAVAAARRLDVLALGDDKAATLGLAPGRWRLGFVMLAAAATALAVSLAGSLAFVGLLAPHVTRLLAAGPSRGRLVLALLVGAGLTAGADAVGRIVIAPAQLPVGIMTALIGAPYFLYLLQRRRTA